MVTQVIMTAASLVNPALNMIETSGAVRLMDSKSDVKYRQSAP